MPTRRTFLTSSVGSLAGLAGLVACSSGSPGTGSGNTPRDGGTLTFATDIEPDVFDPHVSPADIVGVLMRNVFDSLVAQDGDGRFRPWLATSWEVSEDGTAYTFRLRRDVRFTDGTPFDATAVRANLDHIVAPDTASQYAAQLIGPYQGTDILDRYTARVRLSRPHSSFLHAASTTYLGFHSPKALRENPGELNAGGRYSVGTGPFTFASRVQGQRLEFRRNADYAWPTAGSRATRPHLDRLAVTFLPENATRVGAVTSGQADIADFLPTRQVPTLQQHPALQVVSHASPGVVYSYYLNTQRAPLDRREVRLALRYAVDTGAITRAVSGGQYERAWSPLSPSTPGYDASLEESWGHDPERAAHLLDEAGWTGRDGEGYRTRDGRRLALTLLYVPQYTKAERRTYDTAVQDALRKVGVRVELVPMDPGRYTPRRDRGDYHVIAFAWGGSDPGLLRTVFHSDSQLADGGANGCRLRDAQVDGWLDEALRTQDRRTRAALYGRVQRRVIEEGYALPAFVGTRYLAVRKRARGVSFDASAWPLFHDAWVSDGR